MSSEDGIERLARRMYEAAHPAGAPWPHNGWNVRQAWLGKARQSAGVGSEVEYLPMWRRIKLLLRLEPGRLHGLF